jgi:hypothetical protein
MLYSLMLRSFLKSQSSYFVFLERESLAVVSNDILVDALSKLFHTVNGLTGLDESPDSPPFFFIHTSTSSFQIQEAVSCG